ETVPANYAHLLDPLQPLSIKVNISCNLIRLASDAINLSILSIHFLSCRQCQLLQSRSSPTKQVQVILNFPLLLIITLISLKLILRPRLSVSWLVWSVPSGTAISAPSCTRTVAAAHGACEPSTSLVLGLSGSLTHFPLLFMPTQDIFLSLLLAL